MTRKRASKPLISLKKVPIIDNLSSKFDFIEGLGNGSLRAMIDTFECSQTILALRQQFLQKNCLLLTCNEISTFAYLEDGTCQSVSHDQMMAKAFELLCQYTDNSLTNIEFIKGVVFSNSDMADNQTLKHPFSPGASPGHFIYFELDF